LTETASKKSGSKKKVPVLTAAQKNKAEKIAEAMRVVKLHKAQNRIH